MKPEQISIILLADFWTQTLLGVGDPCILLFAFRILVKNRNSSWYFMKAFCIIVLTKAENFHQRI
jgi:hypothetical protein